MQDFEKLLAEEVAGYGLSSWTGEIGGQTVTLYSKPLSPADTDAISKKHKDFVSSPNFGGMVDAIIRKAVDEDGNKLFNAKHRPLLLKMQVDKIGDIFSKLFGNQYEDDDEDGIEGMAKNSD
jgi:hypothetical protein